MATFFLTFKNGSNVHVALWIYLRVTLKTSKILLTKTLMFTQSVNKPLRVLLAHYISQQWFIVTYCRNVQEFGYILTHSNQIRNMIVYPLYIETIQSKHPLLVWDQRWRHSPPHYKPIQWKSHVKTTYLCFLIAKLAMLTLNVHYDPLISNESQKWEHVVGFLLFSLQRLCTVHFWISFQIRGTNHQCGTYKNLSSN